MGEGLIAECTIHHPLGAISVLGASPVGKASFINGLLKLAHFFNELHKAIAKGGKSILNFQRRFFSNYASLQNPKPDHLPHSLIHNLRR
jgi:hypothetical protein